MQRIAIKSLALALIAAFGIAIAPSASADSIAEMKREVGTILLRMLQTYDERIEALEEENAQLEAEVARLRSLLGESPQATGDESSADEAETQTSASQPNNSDTEDFSQEATPEFRITLDSATDEKYANIMQKIIANTEFILRANDATGGEIAMFEFIEPDAFFISIDTGDNPAGQAAFAKKVLYDYDPDTLDMRVVGIFQFDFSAGRYVTEFGANPHADSIRVRVKNPDYSGKLLVSAIDPETGETTDSDDDTTANAPSASTPETNASGWDGDASESDTPSTQTQDSTRIAEIRTAYEANRIAEAIELADAYLRDFPSDIDVRKIRYRGLYLLQRYDEALSEVRRVENLQGQNLETVVACDGYAIARLAGDADEQSRFQGLCER